MSSLFHSKTTGILAGLALGLLLAGGLFAPGLGQELDTSDLKPLGPPYDTSRYDFSSLSKNKPSAPPPAVKEEGGKVILSGKVQTLQQAIVEEKDLVDWYAWYLSVREYLKSTGSLNECELGTEIVFFKNGKMDARTPDARCRLSVTWRHFPLPRNTRLDALILPVRKQEDVASPEEIYRRVEERQQQI